MSAPPNLSVNLPAGGQIPLRTREEVDIYNQSKKKYIDDYQLAQQNDLNLLGAILTQQIILFRAQQTLAGMKLEIDAAGVPTGRYVVVESKPAEMKAAQATLILASDEIQKIEKSLGVDKKTRESGGQHTVQQYLLTLKAAARDYGLHLSKRLTEYERVMMDARQRLRILRNADDEDRQYHQISEASICTWLEGELAGIEEMDRKFAKEQGRLYGGKL